MVSFAHDVCGSPLHLFSFLFLFRLLCVIFQYDVRIAVLHILDIPPSYCIALCTAVHVCTQLNTPFYYTSKNMFAVKRVAASSVRRLPCVGVPTTSQGFPGSHAAAADSASMWHTPVVSLPVVGALSSAAPNALINHQVRSFATDGSGVGIGVEVTKTEGGSGVGSSGRTPIGNASGADASRPSISTDESTCSHGISTDPNLLDGEDNDEEDMEEMFVEPDACLGTSEIEWGGPRRGGKFAEPTRFGDWERKGRCTDF